MVEWFTWKPFTVGVSESVLRIWLGVFNYTIRIGSFPRSKRQWVVFWCTDHLSISLGGDAASSSINDPWWWRICINPADILLGRAVTSRMLDDVQDVVVPMVERIYPAKAVRWTETTRRPRWFAQHALVTEIAIVGEGIPCPMPWGQDTESSDIFYGDTAGAIAQFITMILRKRRKHGGSYEWTPRERTQSGA